MHRKGATRAFPPHHPLIPVDYQFTGQPVLIGGTMGTCSYVLTGTEKGMVETFGSTCHGAGRARRWVHPLCVLGEGSLPFRTTCTRFVCSDSAFQFRGVFAIGI